MDKDRTSHSDTPEQAPNTELPPKETVHNVGGTAIQASLLTKQAIEQLQANERNRTAIEKLMQPELGPNSKSVRTAQGWMAKNNDLTS